MTYFRALPLASGARGRNRTADTMIFSHVLYQLSYPGVASVAACEDRRAMERCLWRRRSTLASPQLRLHQSSSELAGGAARPGME